MLYLISPDICSCRPHLSLAVPWRRKGVGWPVRRARLVTTLFRSSRHSRADARTEHMPSLSAKEQHASRRHVRKEGLAWRHTRRLAGSPADPGRQTREPLAILLRRLCRVGVLGRPVSFPFFPAHQEIVGFIVDVVLSKWMENELPSASVVVLLGNAKSGRKFRLSSLTIVMATSSPIVTDSGSDG
jgi:hypothetical protein